VAPGSAGPSGSARCASGESAVGNASSWYLVSAETRPRELGVGTAELWLCRVFRYLYRTRGCEMPLEFKANRRLVVVARSAVLDSSAAQITNCSTKRNIRSILGMFRVGLNSCQGSVRIALWAAANALPAVSCAHHAAPHRQGSVTPLGSLSSLNFGAVRSRAIVTSTS
jgi:hypothetical protein